MLRWLRQWGLVVLALVAIWFLSTTLFSSEATERFFARILTGFLPSLTAAQIYDLNHHARKLAHVIVYGVLAFTLWRALRYGRAGWDLTAAKKVLGIVVVVALLDEFHQWLIPSRGGALRDVALDVLAAGLVLLLIRWRARRSN